MRQDAFPTPRRTRSRSTADGTDIERDDLVYSVNEWDNYAVEEAIQIVDRVGGNVTVVSIGDEDAEEVVRREMAMGANQGVLLTDAAFERLGRPGHRHHPEGGRRRRASTT